MQSFAVIPAAGRSQRMGQAKLLLPWGSGTLIEHVLGVWRSSGVSQVVIVVHPDDGQLAQLARAGGTHVVQPAVAPSEMKVSVRLALEFIEQTFGPAAGDAWLLSPADIPGIDAATIDALLAVHQPGSTTKAAEILVPRSAGQRGHPVLFDWSLAAEVARLPADQGVNALLTRHRVEYLERSDVAVDDLDTPDDYTRLAPKP